MKQKISKLNTEWHLANKMSKNATVEERIKWHTEHAKNCQCRTGIPAKLQAEMKKRSIKTG